LVCPLFLTPILSFVIRNKTQFISLYLSITVIQNSKQALNILSYLTSPNTMESSGFAPSFGSAYDDSSLASQTLASQIAGLRARLARQTGAAIAQPDPALGRSFGVARVPLSGGLPVPVPTLGRTVAYAAPSPLTPPPHYSRGLMQSRAGSVAEDDDDDDDDRFCTHCVSARDASPIRSAPLAHSVPSAPRKPTRAAPSSTSRMSTPRMSTSLMSTSLMSTSLMCASQLSTSSACAPGTRDSCRMMLTSPRLSHRATSQCPP
jgi:hypothetical protein